MKPYKVTAQVTNAYTVEVHAETEDDAQAQVEDMDSTQVENAGEFEEFVGVEVTDVEVLHPEDQDEDNVGVVLEQPKVKLNEDGSIDLDSLKGSDGTEEVG